jgi:hypothetical protein
MMNVMQLRPFRPDDAVKILSWCKDKHAFRLWSADRYKDFPARPEEIAQWDRFLVSTRNEYEQANIEKRNEWGLDGF